jgi:hypothetical protein
MGTNRVRVPFPSPEDVNRPFPKRCFLVFKIPDDGQSPETQYFRELYTTVRILQFQNSRKECYHLVQKILRPLSYLKAQNKDKLRRLSPRKNYTVRAAAACTFEDRGCRVVSMTDPYGRILGFLDWSRYSFFQVTSSIVLMRLSGPCSRPITSQKIW